MIRVLTIKQVRSKRVARIRAVVRGTKDRPRLAFSRSHYALYGQFVDDNSGKTIDAGFVRGKNTKAASELAAKLLEKLKKHHIKTVVFDRGGYKYHGVVKTFVDAVREGGIIV